MKRVSGSIRTLVLLVLSGLLTPEALLAQGAGDQWGHAPQTPSIVAAPFHGEFLPEDWTWQFLPKGLLWPSYLAGPREPRFGTAWLHESDRGWVWDSTLGGRVGILRYGAQESCGRHGWQLDIEGASFPRLDLEDEADLDSTDYRFGIPLTWRRGRWQFKCAYYHLSSHAGDEFLERHPGFSQINFSRNALVLGAACFPIPELRLYVEADYGFDIDGGNKPWWFQLGSEWSPAGPTGVSGAPFVAINALLREEVEFGGSVNLLGGRAWRGTDGHLLRAGLQYFNGKTSQFEFFPDSEQLIGGGIWLDY